MFSIPNFFPMPNMASVANQKPKKVIYVDLKGNQKVYTASEHGGYQEDNEDERNVNSEEVKPVLDIENYDGVTYQGVIEN